MFYGEQVVGESHLVGFVRLYETRQDEVNDFGDSRRKKFLRGINKVVRGSEHSLLYVSFI